MKIEILFPEYSSLFADSSNVKYLRQCIPDAEFVETHLNDTPLFVNEVPALIYMGAMTERAQETIIRKMMPYKDRIAELIAQNVPMLFTNNALEIFGQYIENEDGSKIECLGLYPIYAKRDMMHRFNCLVRAHFGEMVIVGFKTQFTMAYGETDRYPFMHIERGTGMNKTTEIEGIWDHHFFATYLVGPFLVLNPLFTKYLIQDVMGLTDHSLVYENVIMEAYERRLKEFYDPKVEF